MRIGEIVFKCGAKLCDLDHRTPLYMVSGYRIVEVVSWSIVFRPSGTVDIHGSNVTPSGPEDRWYVDKVKATAAAADAALRFAESMKAEAEKAAAEAVKP